MIDETWRRISGFHVEESGDIGVVWLALDTMADVTHVYDAAIFRQEVFAVIAEGISARGRWIPMAWHKESEEFSKRLLDLGINVLPEASADSQSASEVISRDIWQRMRSSRFRVDQRVGEWLQEYNSFFRDEGAKVRRQGYPLMSATRHAIEQLQYAKATQGPRGRKQNYPKIPIV